MGSSLPSLGPLSWLARYRDEAAENRMLCRPEPAAQPPAPPPTPRLQPTEAQLSARLRWLETASRPSPPRPPPPAGSALSEQAKAFQNVMLWTHWMEREQLEKEAAERDEAVRAREASEAPKRP